VRAADRRVALCLTLMFVLAPATRWGYFAYPVALLGWLALAGRWQEPDSPAAASTLTPEPATAAGSPNHSPVPQPSGRMAG
jgi:hypothetical protein